MLEQVKNMFRKVKDLHHQLYMETEELKPKTRDMILRDKVDSIYAMRKMEDLLDDLRKEVKKCRRHMETIACFEFLSEEIDKFSTEHCSARIEIKQYAKFPHKRREDPDNYDVLLADMGVPQELIDSEALRIHYDGFKNFFSKRQEEGQPLLKGIDPQAIYTDYNILTRKKKDVDE